MTKLLTGKRTARTLALVSCEALGSNLVRRIAFDCAATAAALPGLAPLVSALKRHDPCVSVTEPFILVDQVVIICHPANFNGGLPPASYVPSSKDVAMPDSSERRHWAIAILRRESETFVETLAALDRLNNAAEPHAERLDQNPDFAEAIKIRMDRLSADKRPKFHATIMAAKGLLIGTLTQRYTRRPVPPDDTKDQDLGQSDSEFIDPLSLLPDEDMRKQAQEDLDEHLQATGAEPDFKIARKGETYSFRIEDPEIASAFWSLVGELHKYTITPAHTEIMRRSILTMSVSSFEILIGNARRAQLTSHVNSLGDKEKIFSLGELLQFDSIDDAIEETIEREVDVFVRQGLRKWHSWFKGKPLEVDLASCAINWAETHEVFERRNVVVHNSGRATRQYIQTVDSALADQVTEGDLLSISREYLDHALEHLLTLGILLSFGVRVKLYRQEDVQDAAQWILDQQYSALKERRFKCAARIADFVDGFDLSGDRQLRINVNGWIAKQEDPNAPDPTPEIEKWDTSALEKQLQLAKLVLLGRDQEGVQLLERLHSSGDVSNEDLTDWPLFARYRQEGLISHLLPLSGGTEQESESTE